MTVIVDTLRGSKAARIMKFRMDQNPFYGKGDQVPVFQLRQVLNFLILHDYLLLTDDEYPIVKLTSLSESVLEGEESVVMKVAKEEPKVKKDKKQDKKGKKTKVVESLDHEVDRELFQQLRELRLEIAKEEKVPPYIVFSDKTLIHMCQLKPGNKEEMLEVSGVGEMKYGKYGERFLSMLLCGISTK